MATRLHVEEGTVHLRAKQTDAYIIMYMHMIK